jgi:hypothetical protein
MNNKKIIAETVIKLGKTDIELNNVKNDLTNAKIDLASKLEGTILNYFWIHMSNLTGNLITHRD